MCVAFFCPLFRFSLFARILLTSAPKDKRKTPRPRDDDDDDDVFSNDDDDDDEFGCVVLEITNNQKTPIITACY